MRRALLALLLLRAPAAAHDAPSGATYPPLCCDGTDCAEVPCAEIVPVEHPYGHPQWRHGQAVFGEGNVRQPIDDSCHVCKSGALARCIIFPRAKMSWSSHAR